MRHWKVAGSLAVKVKVGSGLSVAGPEMIRESGAIMSRVNV